MVRLSDDIVHTVTALRRDLDMRLCGEWVWGVQVDLTYVCTYVYTVYMYVHTVRTYVTVYLSVIVIIAVNNRQ